MNFNINFKDLKKKFGLGLAGMLLSYSSSFSSSIQNNFNKNNFSDDGIIITSNLERPIYSLPNYSDSYYYFIDETLASLPSLKILEGKGDKKFDYSLNLQGNIGEKKFEIYYNTLNQGNLVHFRYDWKDDFMFDSDDIELNFPKKYSNILKNNSDKKYIEKAIKIQIASFVGNKLVKQNYENYSLNIKENFIDFEKRVFDNLDIDIFKKGKCDKVLSNEIAIIDNEYSVCVDLSGFDDKKDFVKVKLNPNYNGGLINDGDFYFDYEGSSEKYANLTQRLNNVKIKDAFYSYLYDAEHREKFYEKFVRKNSSIEGNVLSYNLEKLKQFRLNSILNKRHSDIFDLNYNKVLKIQIQENSLRHISNSENKFGHMQIGGNAIQDVDKFFSSDEKFQLEKRMMLDYFQGDSYKNNEGLNSLYANAYLKILDSRYSKNITDLYSPENKDKLVAISYQLGPLLFDLAQNEKETVLDMLDKRRVTEDFVKSVSKKHKRTSKNMSIRYINSILNN